MDDENGIRALSMLIILLQLHVGVVQSTNGRVTHQYCHSRHVAGQPYEKHYLFEKVTNNRKRLNLHDEITAHFLAIQVYVKSLAMQYVRD